MCYKICIASPPTTSTPTRHHQHHAQGLPREGVPYSFRLFFFCRCSCYCGCASKDYVELLQHVMVEKQKDNEGMMWRINVASKEMLRAPVTSESGVGSQTGLKQGGTRSCCASSFLVSQQERRPSSRLWRFFFLNFWRCYKFVCSSLNKQLAEVARERYIPNAGNRCHDCRISACGCGGGVCWCAKCLGTPGKVCAYIVSGVFPRNSTAANCQDKC